MTIEDEIRGRLADFAPLETSIEDQSHQHAGHGASGGHYRLTIVSDHFAGRSLLERHRMVYAAMGDLMSGPIHALSIQARTREEAAARP